MSWIFRDGLELTDEAPEQYYVYVWWHANIARYVGKGTGYQWNSHLSRPLDTNPEKDKYFLRYGKEMSCEIVTQGVSEHAAHGLEAGRLQIP